MTRLRQRLLGLARRSWRFAWSLLPAGGGAMRIRLAARARRVFGKGPAPGTPARDPQAVRLWLQAHATPSRRDRAAMAAHIAALADPPRLSLLLDARGATPSQLATTLGSVRAQRYGHWELRVLGGPSGVEDRRIGDVAEAGDPAWASPAGDWVMPLWAGDRLTETALYRLAVAAAADPDLAIIYGDEIRPEPGQPGTHPWFKPDFDRDRLLGADLFGHAVAFRRGVLGADAAMPGGWYGRGLRAALGLDAARIRHLPALLCERPPEAPGPDAAAEAGAVAAALSAQGVAAEVRMLPPAEAGWRRVVWPQPKVPPLVSVIVPTRDRAALVAACAEGVLQRTDYPALEFLLVDNGSTEAATHALFERLRADPRVRILAEPGAFNYAALNNAAAAAARGDILLLLNNDVEVMAGDWLRELVSHAVRPDVGAVGAKLLYADRTLQHGGVVTGAGGVAGHYRLGVPREDAGHHGSLAMVREVAAVTAACMALRRATFASVGGFDATHLAVAFNDIDLCLRIREAGGRILWTPFAELLHLESASRGEDVTAEKARRFAGEVAYMQRRWGKALLQDPFYNSNLELDGAADALAASPRQPPPWQPFRTGRFFFGP